jgi:hypothetical protein
MEALNLCRGMNDTNGINMLELKIGRFLEGAGISQ